MNDTRRRPVFVWVFLVGFCLLHGGSAPAQTTSVMPAAAACFAPGTPQEVIEAFSAQQVGTMVPTSLQVPSNVLSPPAFTFQDTYRWGSTATNPGALGQGDPTTLTWSIVPDGTSIYGYQSGVGESTAPSNLRAFLNGIYGNEATWLAIFQQVFDRWSELTGVTYVYEPNDDGSAWTSSFIATGQLGVRGDLRIAGHHIDGNSGILAYNFYPDFGDMVIDTDDNFFSDISNSSLKLRNVLAHEHGHGLGLRHVCPVSQTKLMEPFVSVNFDGPQHDDILAANRGYGDDNESNDSSGAATALGSVSGPDLVTDVSIDDDADGDFLSFTAASDTALDATLTPVGSTYLSGMQNPNGSCSAGTNFDSLTENDLGLQILDSDGTSVLAMSTANPAGVAESVSDVDLGAGGTFFVNVMPGFDNKAQLYSLSLDVHPLCTTPSQNLSGQNLVNVVTTVTGCSITAGSSYIIGNGSDVTFSAKSFIALTAGFEVLAGAAFTAELDPSIP